MLKKGDRFIIDWDKLIREEKEKEFRHYQKLQKKKYGDSIFVATRVRQGTWIDGKIVEYVCPDNPKLMSGIGERFIRKQENTE